MTNVGFTPDYPLLDRTFTYRPDLPEVAVNPDLSNVVLAPGMAVLVVSAYRDWNGVAGLDMLFVYVPSTGMYTHVTPADLGYVGAL